MQCDHRRRGYATQRAWARGVYHPYAYLGDEAADRIMWWSEGHELDRT